MKPVAPLTRPNRGFTLRFNMIRPPTARRNTLSSPPAKREIAIDSAVFDCFEVEKPNAFPSFLAILVLPIEYLAR